MATTKNKEEFVEAVEKAAAEADALMRKVVPQKTLTDLQREEKQKQVEMMNERVKIRLFKDSGDHADDVVVCWNGRVYQIQRGVDVSIPRGVEEILKNNMRQDIIASEMADRISNVNLGER